MADSRHLAFSERFDVNDSECGNINYTSRKAVALVLAAKHSREHLHIVTVFDRMAQAGKRVSHIKSFD